jgi:hypothetical protein
VARVDGSWQRLELPRLGLLGALGLLLQERVQVQAEQEPEPEPEVLVRSGSLAAAPRTW